MQRSCFIAVDSKSKEAKMNNVNPRGAYKRMHDKVLEKFDLVSVGFAINYGTINV